MFVIADLHMRCITLYLRLGSPLSTRFSYVVVNMTNHCVHFVIYLNIRIIHDTISWKILRWDNFFYFKSSIETTYCESTFISWHQFSWFLQNPLIPGFLNSWFQTLQATINGKIVFKWTTKSTKIRTPWLIMVSQYLSLW